MIWDGNGHPVPRGCCAACVRGTKAFGETSCGLNGKCKCHTRYTRADDATTEDAPDARGTE